MSKAIGYYGITPYEIIMQHRKMSVLHFFSEARYRKPVICIPALISRSYILDLSPGLSLIESLCAAGHDVYLIDWGMMSDEDAGLSLQVVVRECIARAVKRVRRFSRAKRVTLLGYCMGGTLALMYSALCKSTRKDNLILLAAPYDFEAGGVLARWCKRRYLDIERITQIFGNVPAHMVETVFTLLRPTAKARAALAFGGSYKSKDSVSAFAAMDRWANDWVAFPGAAAREWVEWFYQENRLCSRRLRFNGTPIDPDNIEAATLIVAAPGDAIVPADSSRAVRYALGSSDITYREVDGGHIGMVASKVGRAQLFPLLKEWLETRSG
ncbi:MAG: alpha/beta fold hydrolase [Candidatus Eremiobacteraeota bacterium]|nr:alpha/beta fold hydrolase [Candidatus Eremiobacteraeota bacterium]